MRTIQLCPYSRDDNKFDVYCKSKKSSTWFKVFSYLSFSELQIIEEITRDNTMQSAILHSKSPHTSICIVTIWKIIYHCELEWIDRDYQELMI